MWKHCMIGQMIHPRTTVLGEECLVTPVPSMLFSCNNLSGLQLNGKISPAIGNLKELGLMDLSYNNLHGKIPISISKLKQLEYLNLVNNRLTGLIPSTLPHIANLKYLKLARNKLNGVVPPRIYENEHLLYLDLEDNNFEGSLTLERCRFTALRHFNAKKNNLTGSIPPTIGNCSRIQYLDLSQNQLTGEIPSGIGFLNLLNLYLYENKLTGAIPPELASISTLRYLDLHDNQLTGHIPLEFGKLLNLLDINIADNNLEGPIPDCLSSCVNLIRVDISSNDIMGPIPSTIATLEHLTYLNLSNNHLSASIPTELGGLKTIIIMDLSTNNLSGPFPQELNLLPSLILLNVSYNNLVGNINNFSSFPPDSFIGNPDICGYWMGSHCDSSLKQPKAYVPTIIILCIVGSSSSVLILLIVLVATCRRKPPVNNGPPKLVLFDTRLTGLIYEDIMRATENLNVKYIIGHGGSSTIYKCVLPACKPIAIKKIHMNIANVKQFKTELRTLGKIRHSKLVRLQGYSLSPSGNLLLYEFMENGSLSDVLHESTERNKLGWEQRLRIALGTAQGLEYLHLDCSPQIIHRDIKSANILLDEEYEGHISDFGIAKTLSIVETSALTDVMGTLGYIDPEYAQTSIVNEKVDVYSYGIVLLELLTGRKALDIWSNFNHQMQADSFMEASDPVIAATCKDLDVIKEVFKLALRCTQEKQMDRPTMHEVCFTLQCLIERHPPQLA